MSGIRSKRGAVPVSTPRGRFSTENCYNL